MELNFNRVFTGIVQVLILLLAVSVHEAAHAWSSLRCGDDTAFRAGRLTINPIRHLDPLGTVLVPILLVLTGGPVFGWARPTPVRVDRLRDPHRDHLLVVLSGPLANLLLALVALSVLAASLGLLGSEAGSTASLSLIRDLESASRSAHFPLLFTVVQFALLNGFLAVFNLLPIPPLDGGQIVLQLLPPEWAVKYSVIRPYGFIIVLGLAALNLLSILVLPIYVLIAVTITVAS
jgi:Zn-dependent protease